MQINKHLKALNKQEIYQDYLSKYVNKYKQITK